MTVDEIIIEMVRAGIITLVSSKVCKAIGEKDISEIIYGAGICVVGANAIKLFIPLANTIKSMGNGISAFVDKLNNIGTRIEGLFGDSKAKQIWDAVINFGDKEDVLRWLDSLGGK